MHGLSGGKRNDFKGKSSLSLESLPAIVIFLTFSKPVQNLFAAVQCVIVFFQEAGIIPNNYGPNKLLKSSK